MLHAILHHKGTPHELPACIASIEERDGVRIVHLQGDIGADEVPEASAYAEQLREAGELLNRHLVLDFRQVDHADSTTVAFLVESLREYLGATHHIALVHLTDELASYLEIAKVRDLFLVYGSVEEAIDALEA